MTTSDTARSVSLERLGTGTYLARNAAGDELAVGGPGAFTPVELLLAALGACSAIDVDVATSRRATPSSFTVRVDAHKVQEAGANVLRDIAVTFAVTFPDGPDGDAARAVLPRAARVAHDRTCTVSRTVEAGVPVAYHVEQSPPEQSRP